ncbi:MAG: cytochrome b N-terminal domain-containing protein, partial [Anaerolineaceae bacterium]
MTVKESLLYTSKTDDRGRMRAVANNLILHIHPTKVAKPALRFSYTWGLGGISTLLAMILVITGVLLMFRYDASVDRAYTSIQTMETEVLFGSLIRATHHWSANLLIITAFLHMLRVFFSGGFKKGRATNWLVGLALLLLVIAFNFTGYLLPWDQLAYWAITVGTSLLDYVPLVGSAISGFLLAGPEVGQGALRNFYAIHVAVLPAILVVLMSYHFWKVRKDGGISQPVNRPTGADGKRQRAERVTTIPYLVQIELAATAVVVTAPLLFAMFTPAPLEALANPNHPPNPAKA